MREVVIVDGVRTPIARAGKYSWFANIRADDLGAICLKEIVKRNDIDPTIIEDVLWGNTSSSILDQGRNVGRMTVIISGLPLTIPGCTIDRYCASSLQAIQYAITSIMAGWGDCMIAGGVQHMTHVPMGYMKDDNPKLGDYIDIRTTSMGWTAEFIAREKKVSRLEQDEWALGSHQKATRATNEGKFKNEIVPVEVEALQRDGSNLRMVANEDQGIRKDLTMEQLSKLKPVFLKDELATVTAGNSSQMNDAAAAMLIMAKEKAKEYGLKPRLKMLSHAGIGVDPRYTMLGPVYSIPIALKRAGLTKEDIDVWEVNEAFAAQSVVCNRELGLPVERVNLWGSGISLGHPLGCTGARITTTFMNIMDETNAKYGVVSMCNAFGQGNAAVFERLK